MKITSSKFFLFGALWCAFFSFTLTTQAQCVVINEILVNGAGACDGNCAPSTEEWVELYNTCGTPVNIGCWVIGDGDWSAVIPAGTILQPGEHYVIGSVNAGFAVDLDLATCNCTSGANIGIFTNGNEQVALVDNTGAFQDGVYWGNGQFPATISAPALNGCTAVNVNFANQGTNFEPLPGGGANGCSLARECDGSTTWIERCGTAITGNASNGIPAVPDFSISETQICPSDCISLTDESSGNPFLWTWTVTGPENSLSYDQLPSFCYTGIGTYDVTLEITNACGTYSTTQIGAFAVAPAQPSVITANGPLTFCQGGSVVLEVNGTGIIQWYQNGLVIANQNNTQLTVTQSGDYYATVSQGACTSTSQTLTVTVGNAIQPPISANGPLTFCEGSTVTLSTITGMDTYQWFQNGIPLPLENTSSITIPQAGDYTVQAALGLCSGISEPLTITVQTITPPVISSQDGLQGCSGETIVLDAPAGYDTYQWLNGGSDILGAFGSSLETNQNGFYTAVVTLGDCEAASNVLMVEFFTPDELTISPSQPLPICDGTEIMLMANSGVEWSSYQWFENGVLMSGENSDFISTSGNSTYTVEAVFNGICNVTSEPFVVVISNPDPIVLNVDPTDGFLCSGEMAAFTAQPGLIGYSWYFNGELIPFQNNNTYFDNQPGTYTFQAIVDGCNVVSNDIILEVVPSPIVTITPDAIAGNCTGNPEPLTASGGVTYQWLLNGTPINNATTANYSAPSSGSYSVIAYNEFGCSTQSSITEVSIFSPIDFEIVTADLTPCEGSVATLNISPTTFDEVTWVDITNQNSVTLGTAAEITLTSSAVIKATVLYGQCMDVVSIQIAFVPTPIANAGPDVSTDCETGIQINASGVGVPAWSPDLGLSNPNILNPIANPDETTVYTLTVNNGGCESTDQVIVYAECVSFYVPNVFTPNADGVNDIFRAYTTGVAEFSLQVFSRWGHLIWETTNPEESWVGEYRGSPVPDGTYMWIMTAYGATGKNLLTFDQGYGYVTLLR